MANETKVFLGTSKTLEANGGSIANNAVGQADDATYSISADGSSYPDAEFTLSCAFATAPTEGAVIDLLAQELDVDGTNDEQSPEATYRAKALASFVVNNVTTTQYLNALVFNVPRLANYWLYNNATGQTISTGWTLKVLPRTFGPV